MMSIAKRLRAASFIAAALLIHHVPAAVVPLQCTVPDCPPDHVLVTNETVQPCPYCVPETNASGLTVVAQLELHETAKGKQCPKIYCYPGYVLTDEDEGSPDECPHCKLIAVPIESNATKKTGDNEAGSNSTASMDAATPSIELNGNDTWREPKHRRREDSKDELPTLPDRKNNETSTDRNEHGTTVSLSVNGVTHATILGNNTESRDNGAIESTDSKNNETIGSTEHKDNATLTVDFRDRSNSSATEEKNATASTEPSEVSSVRLGHEATTVEGSTVGDGLLTNKTDSIDESKKLERNSTAAPDETKDKGGDDDNEVDGNDGA